MKSTAEIKAYWDSQADLYGTSLYATMPDMYAKELEIKNILKYIKDGDSVADIGCGNGYSSFYYAKNRNIRLVGYDYSEKMIQLAKSVLIKDFPYLKDNLSFKVEDILNLKINEKYNCVITDRCLINLISLEEQVKAALQIYNILEDDGIYIMCEDTKQGLERLNSLRKLANLEIINERWHNLYLDEEEFLNKISAHFDLIQIDNFSSLYYISSRIINAKIAQKNNVKPDYNSDINKYAGLISSVGEFGDFGPLKIFVLKKK